MRAKTLGAVLAGGQSARFGSDKALARLGEASLLQHAIASLQLSCAEVLVIGREGGIADWPKPGMGPLGGIAGALRCAQAHGFEEVLSCGVDSIGLPENLLTLLSPSPAYVDSQPVIGLWPVRALADVEAILAGDGRHSMRALAETIAARRVKLPAQPFNINTPQDLADLATPDDG